MITHLMLPSGEVKCHLCKARMPEAAWSEHAAKVHHLYSGKTRAVSPSTTHPCINLGERAKESDVRCKGCANKNVTIFAYSCSIYGKCTIGPNQSDIKSCRGCSEYRPSLKSFSKPPAIKAQAVEQTARKSTGMFSWDGVTIPEFIKTSQLVEDVKTLVSGLSPSTSGVIGIARSGLMAATLVSMYMHRPLYVYRQSMGDLLPVGNGWRLTGHVNDTGPLVVVDDTVMTGNSFKQCLPNIRKQYPTAISAAVYVNPFSRIKPDVWVRDLRWPHVLEWNIFNSILSPHMAFDFDGIFCRDCTPPEDDDGPLYAKFLREAMPLYYVRRTPVSLIVTGRLEKYRKETLEWLARKGFSVKKLLMRASKSEDPAAHKARHFSAFMKQTHRVKPPMFVESDPRQAKKIAHYTGGVVICPSAGRCFKGDQ